MDHGRFKVKVKKLIALLPASALVYAFIWGCSSDTTKREVNPCAKASSLSLEIGSDAAKAQFVVAKVQTPPRPGSGTSTTKPKTDSKKPSTGSTSGATSDPNDTGKQTKKPATTTPSPKAQSTAQTSKPKKYKPIGAIKAKKTKGFPYHGHVYTTLYIAGETEYYLLLNGNVLFVEYEDYDLPDGVEYDPSSDGNVVDYMAQYLPSYIPGDPTPSETATIPPATDSPIC